ncbi:hypothetical protein ACS0TY_007326 [Phlomoides rotata]
MATTEQDFCARVTLTPNAVLEKMQEWKGMGENLLKSLVDCFSDIESREQALSLGMESLEKRKRDLEEREKKFDLLEEEKKGELMLREEKLDEQLKLVREHIASLEGKIGKLKEVESREREIDGVCGSIEKRLRDVEKREMEFDKLYNVKTRELELREDTLRKEKKQFAEEVKLVNQKLEKKQKVGCDLIERLESALKLLGRMKGGVDGRFKEMESMEESLTAKLNEADLIKESLEKRFKELEKSEEEFTLFQEDKTRKLESKEQQLTSMRIELLKLTEEHKLGHMVSKEIESLDKDSPKDADLSRGEFKQSGLPNDHVDLKHALHKDGKILEMFINTTGKDLELMDDEIRKVLLLSSDPARLVLDAVCGFYSSKTGKGSEESKLWRVCFLLLDQLTKMSPIIQPCDKGEAFKLALIWMSNLNTAAENPLEVLMLLHLLAAYKLSPYFEKNELFGFAKLVAQHKQTPWLCRVLGLAEKIPDIIQNLIHEKQYLLASTYVYEYGLENMFPQAAVLDYYVKHSKMSAKKSFESQDMATASEIADLCVGIEHIIKYGLESEYSPDILTERIKQLERNEASLKCRSPSASGERDIQKPREGKRCWDAYAQQKQHYERPSSPPWKAQNWQKSRRNDHPCTSSAVGFQLSRSQKRRRKKGFHDDGKTNF